MLHSCINESSVFINEDEEIPLNDLLDKLSCKIRNKEYCSSETNQLVLKIPKDLYQKLESSNLRDFLI
jgi:hypothetical protein